MRIDDPTSVRVLIWKPAQLRLQHSQSCLLSYHQDLHLATLYPDLRYRPHLHAFLGWRRFLIMHVRREHIGGHVRVHAGTGLLRHERPFNVHRRHQVLLGYGYSERGDGSLYPDTANPCCLEATDNARQKDSHFVDLRNRWSVSSVFLSQF